MTSSTMSSSISEFIILKHFGVSGHAPWAPLIKEVVWAPPLCHWVKCNTDGTARSALGRAACGGLFRDYRAVIMQAIEIAFSRGWRNLWLECDSSLVVDAITTNRGVPWKLRNRWNNCIVLTKKTHFIASHIYREGNTCADRLASHGLALQGIFWWDSLPDFLRKDFFRNRFSLPFYRFK